jgi:hypothetical protein
VLKNFAENHAQNNERNRVFAALRQEEKQQKDYRAHTNDLFRKLHQSRGADVPDPIEEILVQVFNSGQQDAGEKQKKTGLGARVAQ